MFDLNKALTEWRRRMLAAGFQNTEALDELEGHLRDEVEQERRSGRTDAEAFEIAVQRIGHAGALQKEFRKLGHAHWNLLRQLKRFVFGAAGIPFPSLDHFDPGARETLELAPAEARRFCHDFVGTEHVLLGLLGQSGIVTDVLRRFGVDRESVSREIEKLVFHGSAESASGQIPFTPRARRALELAGSEAKALNHRVVKPEHILLGLLAEGSGVAAVVLKNLGVNTESARMEILKVTGSEPG